MIKSICSFRDSLHILALRQLCIFFHQILDDMRLTDQTLYYLLSMLILILNQDFRKINSYLLSTG